MSVGYGTHSLQIRPKIEIRPHFGWSRICKNGRFWPEAKSGTALYKIQSSEKSLMPSGVLFMLYNRNNKAAKTIGNQKFIRPAIQPTLTITTIDLVRRLQIERRRITMSGTIKTIKLEQFENKNGI